VARDARGNIIAKRHLAMKNLLPARNRVICAARAARRKQHRCDAYAPRTEDVFCAHHQSFATS
jgi:hypothetical protein